MEPVIIALGSNLGDRHGILISAAKYLESISEGSIRKSSIWESEPVGPARYTFLNAVVKMHASQSPPELLTLLKSYEKRAGRNPSGKKWGPRLLDLDIITYGNLVIRDETLIIPHPEYTNRKFVLLPMKEVAPAWIDPESGRSIDQMVETAPEMSIEKTNLTW